MPFRFDFREQLALARYLAKWALAAGPLAAVVGSACALFLWLLQLAAETQWREPRLLYFLPLAGMGIALAYGWIGKVAERGNDLIMDEIHEPGAGVPAQMAPLILLSTVATHLFGGSAGREGTAVQMGGSIASSFARWLKLNDVDRRTMLVAGVAAGFGGVFGTPIAGAIFALEVIAIGRISHESIVPCLLASIVGDWSCAAWGVHHVDYRQVVATPPAIDWLLLGKVAIAGIVFGLASLLFAELAHGLKRVFQRTIPWAVLRPAAGAVLVIALVWLLDTRVYLGLGVTAPSDEPDGASIVASFQPGGADPWSWWWKIVFTVVTLSSGFKGGEVTPLFFIGATLGNALAVLLDAPVDLFAALGFVAVFAGATNTPIACTVMGMELFGAGHAVSLGTACAIAYLFSGHSGIYLSQRIAVPKIETPAIEPGTSLRERRASRLRPILPDSPRTVEVADGDAPPPAAS